MWKIDQHNYNDGSCDWYFVCNSDKTEFDKTVLKCGRHPQRVETQGTTGTYHGGLSRQSHHQAIILDAMFVNNFRTLIEEFIFCIVSLAK